MKLVFLIPLLLFIGCKKNCLELNDKSIVVSTIDLGQCIPPTLPLNEYIIDNDSLYQELLLSSVCTQYSLPSIDFSKYTLLGQYASGKCNVEFKSEVIKDDENKLYNFVVLVCEKGLCKKEGVSMNWVTVPKLPSGYTVKFDIKKK